MWAAALDQRLHMATSVHMCTIPGAGNCELYIMKKPARALVLQAILALAVTVRHVDCMPAPAI